MIAIRCGSRSRASPAFSGIFDRVGCHEEVVGAPPPQRYVVALALGEGDHRVHAGDGVAARRL